jgi:hypothetical protein
MPAPKDISRYQEWYKKVVEVLRANASKGGESNKGKPKPWLSQKLRELWKDEGYRAKQSASRKGKLAGENNPSKRPEVRIKIGKDRKKWWEIDRNLGA